MERKTPGTQLIEQEINLHGPMSFEKFVSLALYHPRYGYYQQKESPRGRKGDYFTSLQVSNLFPQILADAILTMKQMLGTEQFSLIEWGAGDGEFLHGVLQILDQENKLKGIRVWAVEASRSAREKLIRRLSRFPKCQVISSLDEMEIVGGLEGCIFSNEFFDALPFRRLRFTPAGWKEIFVTLKDGQLQETEKEFEDEPLSCEYKLMENGYEEGQEIEIRPILRQWMEDWGGVLQRGFMVTFDYGNPRAELVNPHRMKGTWMCYSQHNAQALPFEKIGKQDITAHLDFTQLAEVGKELGWEPALFNSQGIVLSYLGQDRIQKMLTAPPSPHQKKIIGEIQQLMHPRAMGEAFWALIQTKETILPDSFKAIPNRLKRVL